MTANINSQTGIRYGVVNANNVPWLLEDVMTEGTDNRYESCKEEVVALLQGAEDAESFNAIIDKEFLNQVWAENYHVTQEEFEEGISDERFEEIACEILSDSYESDSDSLSYSLDDSEAGVQYELGSLGGAPLLWITKSPFVAWCLQCSPCVPGAGDLDNILPDPGENATERYSMVLAYCFDPSSYEGNETYATRPYRDGLTLVYELDTND